MGIHKIHYYYQDIMINLHKDFFTHPRTTTVECSIKKILGIEKTVLYRVISGHMATNQSDYWKISLNLIKYI